MPRRKPQPEYDLEACARLAAAVVNHALTAVVPIIDEISFGRNLISFSRSELLEHASSVMGIDVEVIRTKVYQRGLFFLDKSQPKPRLQERFKVK